MSVSQRPAHIAASTVRDGRSGCGMAQSTAKILVDNDPGCRGKPVGLSVSCHYQATDRTVTARWEVEGFYLVASGPQFRQCALPTTACRESRGSASAASSNAAAPDVSPKAL